MRKIMAGMVFVFLDFTINMETSKIGLIPDFVGYILIAQGLSEMATQSPRFAKVRGLSLAMVVYTAILYAFDLFGVTIQEGLLSWLLGLVSTIISLYISYNIVMGVIDIEAGGRNLDGASLLTVWKVYAVISIAIYLLFLVPALNILLIIAGLILGIVFLFAFNRTKKLYYMQ